MKLSNEEANELIARYKSELNKLNYQVAEIEGTIKKLEKSAKSSTSTRRTRKTSTARKSTAKSTAKSTTTKRRGRPPKAKTAAKSTTTKTTTKRRGRPPKAKTAAKSTANKKATTKRRGRPPKAKTAAKSTAKPAAKKSTAKKSTAKKSTAKKADSASSKRGYRLSEWDKLVLDTLNERQKVSVFSDFMDKAKTMKTGLTEKALYARINQSLHKLANKRGELVKVPQKGRGYGYALPEWKSGRGIKAQFK